ncbi:hypothetical protein OUZ56_030916 [Daphnia magna]|uniref:Uncharacterized protein n=1 Tax=Daphnia magna TaxID=35525 RepID=A0ABQ9ZSP1_9CRUS|nr:hypothetical protein OUZ56_030916 [Daphnia magna]
MTSKSDCAESPGAGIAWAMPLVIFKGNLKSGYTDNSISTANRRMCQRHQDILAVFSALIPLIIGRHDLIMLVSSLADDWKFLVCRVWRVTFSMFLDAISQKYCCQH